MRKTLCILLVLLQVFAVTVVSATESIDVPAELTRPVGGVWKQAIPIEIERPEMRVRMSSGAKTLTQTLYEACMAQEEIIDISAYAIPAEDFLDYYYNFCMTHPECLLFTAYFSSVSDGKVRAIKPVYLTANATAAREARALMQAKITAYCNSVKNITDPLEKLLLVHDQIVLDSKYHTEAVNAPLDQNGIIVAKYQPSFHAYGLIANGTAVCQGYAQVLFMVARRLGFEVSYCHNDGHIWNYIKVNNQWYHMDVTWDDPSNMADDVAYHKYFLCSDATMQTNGHATPWKTDRAMPPVCNSKRYESEHLFNFKLPFVTEKRGEYIGFSVAGSFFCAKQLWVGDILTSRLQNGKIRYMYLKEPTTGITAYTVYRDGDGVIGKATVSNTSLQSMTNTNGQLVIHDFTVPDGVTGYPEGTVYFWKQNSVTPMGVTVSL